MSRAPSALSGGNRLLDLLVVEDRSRLTGALEEVELALKELLCTPGERIDSVYFPISSVVSLLTCMQGTSGVEVATIGNEGVVGVSLSWGAVEPNPAELNPAEFLQVQVPGSALRMDADLFTAELASDGGLASVVRRYTQAFVSQLCQQGPVTPCTPSKSVAPAGCS
jgi:hypothetical protein